MGYRVRLGRRATAEVASIAVYLSENLGNPGAASHFLSEFDELLTVLEGAPLAFPESTEPRLAALDHRKAPVMRYIALCRVAEPDEVVIAHVFHQSQDYARLV